MSPEKCCRCGCAVAGVARCEPCRIKHNAHQRKKTAERIRNREKSEEQSRWLNWSGPLKDGQPLWREVESGPLLANFNTQPTRLLDDVREAA